MSSEASGEKGSAPSAPPAYEDVVAADRANGVSKPVEGSLPSSSSVPPHQRGPPPTKAGYLFKMGGIVRNWKRRYFDMDGDFLVYHEEKNGKEKGRILVPGSVVDVYPYGQFNTKGYLFGVRPVTKSRTYIIMAATIEEREEWMDFMEKRGAVRHDKMQQKRLEEAAMARKREIERQKEEEAKRPPQAQNAQPDMNDPFAVIRVLQQAQQQSVASGGERNDPMNIAVALQTAFGAQNVSVNGWVANPSPSPSHHHHSHHHNRPKMPHEDPHHPHHPNNPHNLSNPNGIFQQNIRRQNEQNQRMHQQIHQQNMQRMNQNIANNNRIHQQNHMNHMNHMNNMNNMHRRF